MPPGKWLGYDTPDFAATKAPNAPKPGAIGSTRSGTDPFIMKPDGKGWLFVPTGLVDGPLPVHYEPLESPVANLLYKQQSSPVSSGGRAERPTTRSPRWATRGIRVITTYRLTSITSPAHEPVASASRRVAAELFIEIGAALAQERGIRNLDFVTVTSPRHHIRARALVTNRIGVMTIAGKQIHHVGMPWHWGGRASPSVTS